MFDTEVIAQSVCLFDCLTGPSSNCELRRRWRSHLSAKRMPLSLTDIDWRGFLSSNRHQHALGDTMVKKEIPDRNVELRKTQGEGGGGRAEGACMQISVIYVFNFERALKNTVRTPKDRQSPLKELIGSLLLIATTLICFNSSWLQI